MIEIRPLKIAKNPIVRSLLLVLVATAPTMASAQVSLATVVDLAQRNSSAVKIANADVEKTRAVLAESKQVYVPNLDFGFGLPVFPDVGFTGGVPSIFSGTIQSLVYSPSQNQYIQAARAGLKAATMRLKDAREQVALDAATAYIELDTVNRELDATRQQQSFAGRLGAIEQERAEAGVDPSSELLQSRLTVAELNLKQLHLETRAATLSKQLSVLTGLPLGSITPDHASIPQIPAVKGDSQARTSAGLESARLLAVSKQKIAHGDALNEYLPQANFNALYSRSTTILNNFNDYYQQNIPVNNFSSGISIQIPVFDLGRHGKAHESAADALRATAEAEQAERQSEVQIAELTGTLRELDAEAEVASLKQQIASEQLKTVLAELETGNGSGAGPGTSAQLSPKAEQLARIDERQRLVESLDAELELEKARLGLLRALGHMQDWLNELRLR